MNDTMLDSIDEKVLADFGLKLEYEEGDYLYPVVRDGKDSIYLSPNPDEGPLPLEAFCAGLRWAREIMQRGGQ